MQRALASDPAWLKAAFADLGLHEVPGPKANPRIVAMYAAARSPQIKDDGVAWCSAAMNAWVLEAGIRPTYSLAARSWLEWLAGERLDINRPIPRGAIVIFRRGNSTWQGHVAICLRDYGGAIEVIGGNQSDAVTIARFSKASLLGARWPAGVVRNTVMQTGAVSTASLTAGGVLNTGADGLQGNAQGFADVLGQSTDTFMQLSAYVRWASYALVAISMLMLGITVWHFVKTYIRPRPELVPERGPSIDDELPGGAG